MVEALSKLRAGLDERHQQHAALQSRARQLGVHHSSSIVTDGPSVPDLHTEEARLGRTRGQRAYKDDNVHLLHTPERASQIRAENDARRQRIENTQKQQAAERAQRVREDEEAADRRLAEQRTAEAQPPQQR